MVDFAKQKPKYPKVGDVIEVIVNYFPKFTPEAYGVDWACCDCPCCRAMRAEDDGVLYDIDQLTESPLDYDDENIDDDFDDDYEEDEPPYDYSDPWDELDDDDEDNDDDLTGEL